MCYIIINIIIIIIIIMSQNVFKGPCLGTQRACMCLLCWHQMAYILGYRPVVLRNSMTFLVIWLIFIVPKQSL